MISSENSYHSLSYAYGESGNPFFAVDPGLTIWTWLVFFAVLLVLYKFAWRPILQNLDEREKKIKKSIDEADKISKELDETLTKKKEIIQQANLEAKKIIDNSKENAEKLRAELEKKARDEANAIIDKAQKKIVAETQKALSDLRQESVNLSLEIASKVMQENLNNDKNTELAKKYLQEVQEIS